MTVGRTVQNFGLDPVEVKFEIFGLDPVEFSKFVISSVYVVCAWSPKKKLGERIAKNKAPEVVGMDAKL